MRPWVVWATPFVAVILAVIVGALLIIGFHHNPVVAYSALFQGAFGNVQDIATTLTDSLPLMLTGLGVAFAFRAGLFNIGGEGQYWVGAIVATILGIAFPGLWAPVHIFICIVAAMIAAGLYAAVIPGLLKAYLGAHEVITTMMLSYAMVFFGHYLVENGPMMRPGFIPESRPLAASALLPTLVPGSQLSVGIFLAPVCALAMALLLNRTTYGFGIRTVGQNPRAARYAGIRVPIYTVSALFVSGLFMGLAGSVQVMGVEHQLLDGFNSGYGFTAIVVALLGKNHPWGTLAAAILFGALSAGANTMQINAAIPVQLVNAVEGLIIFFVATEGLIHWGLSRRHAAVQPAPGQGALAG